TDAPPARPAGRLLLALGPDRPHHVPRRPERVHERLRRDVLLQLRLHATAGVQVAADHPVARPARCAVKRGLMLVFSTAAWLAASIAVAFWSAGCPGARDPPWQLDHDRIIAVRATPPGIAAGDKSTLDALIGTKG